MKLPTIILNEKTLKIGDWPITESKQDHLWSNLAHRIINSFDGKYFKAGNFPAKTLNVFSLQVVASLVCLSYTVVPYFDNSTQEVYKSRSVFLTYF